MKHKLAYSELNITNVCNYSCTHCQSLNNFAFKGHQLWNDYRDEYKALSELIDIDQLQIIGGEPTLNPDFEKWVEGISTLWPDTKLQISTNGSRLDKLNSNIYSILKKHKGTLWLTCHDIQLYDSFLEFSKQFLDNIVSDTFDDYDWKSEYEKSKTDTTIELRLISRKIIDKNGVEIILDWSQSFVQSAIDILDGQRLGLKYNSDPKQAHDICYFKTCHQMNKGKLYKCPLVSVLPDFLDQFNVTMSESDKELAYSYKPVSRHDSEDTILNFMTSMKEPIPQCKFCPSKYFKNKFVGTDKKIKIISI